MLEEFQKGDVVVSIGDNDEFLVWANPSTSQYFLRNVKTGQYLPLSKDWVETDFVKVRSELEDGEE